MPEEFAISGRDDPGNDQGIAALDNDGNILAKAEKLFLVRDGTDKIYLYDRTSNEKIMELTRDGANNWSLTPTGNIALADGKGIKLQKGTGQVLVRVLNDSPTLITRTFADDAYTDIRVANLGVVVDGTVDGVDVSDLSLSNHYVIGDTVRISHDTPVSTQNGSYTKLKTITLTVAPNKPTLMRVKFDLKHNGTPTESHAKLYVNGAAVGTERNGTGSYVTYSEDIYLENGDRVELYAYILPALAGHNVYVRNFRITGDTPVANASLDDVMEYGMNASDIAGSTS